MARVTPVPVNIFTQRTCRDREKKAELSQRWPRDASYVWVPWKLSAVP